MSKDPAFLFYSQDFYTGVADMSFEDRGKFISLLCLMHQKGRLSEETIRLIVGSPSVSLKSKFKQDENGFFYNERLESESKKRENFVNSRRTNGLKGGRKKATAQPTDSLMVNHKGSLREDENENKEKGGVGGKEPAEKKVERLAAAWIEDKGIIESLCVNNRLRPEWMPGLIKHFLNFKHSTNELNKSDNDLRKNFVYWIPMKGRQLVEGWIRNRIGEYAKYAKPGT